MKNEGNIDFQATIKVAPTKRRLYSWHRSSSVVEMNRRLEGVCNTPLQSHAIINMNGRIYDPITAQFMQADNFIQTPEDYIGYNRYAYCRYNPFKYVDPSGEMLMMEMDNSSSKGSIDEKYLPVTSSYAMENIYDYIVTTTYYDFMGNKRTSKRIAQGSSSDIRDIKEKSQSNENRNSVVNGSLGELIAYGILTKYPCALTMGLSGGYELFGAKDPNSSSTVFNPDPSKGANQGSAWQHTLITDNTWNLEASADFQNCSIGLTWKNTENGNTISFGLSNMNSIYGGLDLYIGKFVERDGLSYEVGSYGSIPTIVAGAYVVAYYGAGLAASYTMYGISEAATWATTYIFYPVSP